MITGRGGGLKAISAIIFFTIAWPNELWFSATMTKAPGAADHVVAVIFVEPAGRIGVLGIPRQRRVAQDHQPVDGDALRERLVARQSDVAPGIVGAVARHVDGAARAP